MTPEDGSEGDGDHKSEGAWHHVALQNRWVGMAAPNNEQYRRRVNRHSVFGRTSAHYRPTSSGASASICSGLGSRPTSIVSCAAAAGTACCGWPPLKPSSTSTPGP